MDRDLKHAPRIGMGCWAIGGPFWSGDTPRNYSGTNDADSTQAIHAAWDAGVRVFDTASVYGAGHSETLLGAALQDRPDAIIVSKLGHAFNAETKQMIGQRADADFVRDSVEQSRRRLRRDRIDVMLLHLNTLPIPEARIVFDTLAELRDAGHIRSFGWSTDFPENLNAVAARPGFGSVQHCMNIFFDAPSISAAAEANGLTQMIRSPLAMGLLTGKYTEGTRLADNDVRSSNLDWQGYFRDAVASPDYLKQLGAVRDLITVGGRSLAQGALCWLLAKSPATLPLPGAKNAAQATENAAAMDCGPLPADIMAEIEAVLQRPPEGPPRER